MDNYCNMGDNHMFGLVKKEQVILPITSEAPSFSNTDKLTNSNHNLPVSELLTDGKDMKKVVPSLQMVQKVRHLPKSSKLGSLTCSEISKEMATHVRLPRPPGEGRGRGQLLPRYWPRITDQELQQISGDTNSTIVPLFEKVLSASDAGRIGRLVLPKACAEAYFPPIAQPEGLPLKIQDAKGKDWVFQFRFWPNNNSRMYVLEGVTPCIQSMQLQAGDTVTFSRIEPEGKLIMGFRKASNVVSRQDIDAPAVCNGTFLKEHFSGGYESLSVVNGYSGLLHSLKGSVDPHLCALSEHFNLSDGDTSSWLKPDKQNGRMIETPFQRIASGHERKRSRNISTKSKRLAIETEEALELKLTWEEAQDLLRPPPNVKPSIVLLENYELEEYEDPPIFGKRTIFTVRSSGVQDQWVQCDCCNKWRRLPVDVLVESRWTCAENIWDPRSCSCSAPDEISPGELKSLLRMHHEIRKKKVGSHKSARARELHSGLDALASAAVLGDDDNMALQTGPTTKHPRHRPGCMCIVCIQPPSGKGPKHKPSCTCNVCMTVKRRFKTLMMRKRKKQMEKDTETSRKQDWGREEAEIDSSSRWDESQSTPSKAFVDRADVSMIDLNCHPDWEDDTSAMSGRVSMMSLLHVASLPLESYLKEHGLRSLINEQPGSSISLVLPPNGESEGQDVEGS